MRLFSSAFLVFAAAIRCAFGQDCITDLNVIYFDEFAVPDISVPRVYTLCPSTTFTVGVQTQDGFQDGSLPLLLRSNAQVKCGEDGASTNGCIIDGFGTYGIFISPYEMGFPESRVDNVVLQGLTIDQFVGGPDVDQLPVFLGTDGGHVTFLDCVYSNNFAQPFFVLDEYYFLQGPFPEERRLQAMELAGEDEASRLKYAAGVIYNHTHRTKTRKDATDSDLPELGRQHRKLIDGTTLTVTMQSCQFKLNTNFEQPTATFGLTMLRFRGTDFFNIGEDHVGTVDANLFNCIFEDNANAFATDDDNVVRSFIDFYSSGTLRIENTCFLNSPLSTTPDSNLVLVQPGSNVISINNFIDPPQNLSCPFVAEWSEDYNSFLQCRNATANATVCGATTATVPEPTVTVPLPSAIATISARTENSTYFTRLVEAAGFSGQGLPLDLDATSEANGQIVTTFVPDDATFGTDVEYIEMLVSDAAWNLHARCLASSHILLGRVPTTQFEGGRYAITWSQQFVLIGVPEEPQPNVDGIALVEGATDIETSTGLVQYSAAPFTPSCVSLSLYELISDSNFTVLTELIDIAGLRQALSEDAPLTVFAPTDSAFDEVPLATLEALKADPASLQALLLYHVVGANLPVASSIYAPGTDTPITMAEGSDVTIASIATEAGTQFFVNDAFGIVFNDLARNGMLHTIDAVLIPPSGDTQAPDTVPPVGMPSETVAPMTDAPAETVAPMTDAPAETVAPMTDAPAETTSAPVTPSPVSAVDPSAAPVTKAPVGTSPVPVPSAPPSGGMAVTTFVGLAVSFLVAANMI